MKGDYLTFSVDDSNLKPTPVLWVEDKTIEYVRADRLRALEGEIERMKAELKQRAGEYDYLRECYLEERERVKRLTLETADLTERLMSGRAALDGGT
jgi:hypothetical protein